MRSKKTILTVSAAALGLAGLAAPAATAAPASAWDQVAACESGGDWHINTGNGYQGCRLSPRLRHESENRPLLPTLRRFRGVEDGAGFSAASSWLAHSNANSF